MIATPSGAGVLSFLGLGDLPGGITFSRAFGVSADGSVVVGTGNAATGFEAFIWDGSSGMQSIQDTLLGAGVDLTGWQLSAANAISADGLSIVGLGSHNGATEAWLVRLGPATVPAPGAAGLLALAGVFTARRRRRSSACAAV